MWSWSYAFELLPMFGIATAITFAVTAVASTIALGGGLALGILSTTGGAFGRFLVGALLAFLKGTPILVLLYFGFYALPKYGIMASAPVVGITVLGVVYAAYSSEVYRGAILAIPGTMRDATHALNISAWTMWTRIIIPMAVRNSIAPLVSYILLIFRVTTFLFAIGVPVIMTMARDEAEISYRYLEPYTLAGIVYLLLNIPFILLMKKLEKAANNARR